MAYKYAKGKVQRGDIYNQDDTQGNTYLDWSEDAIGFVAGGEAGLVISGSTNEISSSYNLSASAFYGDGSNLENITATASPGGSDGQIQFNDESSMGGAANLYWDGDNDRVGIGTDAPDYTLDVAGDAGFDEYLYHNGDANTYIRFQDDDININCGGKSMVKMSENPSSQDIVTINNAGSDTDFRVKGDGQDNLIRTDAEDDMVGICNSAPAITLDVHYSGSGGPTHLDDDKGGGEVVFFGSSSAALAAGGIYYLNTGGGWQSVDSAATGSGHKQLLGVSLGTKASDDGILIRGYFNVNTFYSGSFIKGGPMYIQSSSVARPATAGGYLSGAAPTAADSYVRVVGYGTDTANVVYFNPDSTYVEIA